MRRTSLVFLLLLGLAASAAATETSLLRERRQRAATAFPDGILLFHASVALDIHADGFHQDAFFYDGAELLTPGVPYSAEAIEVAIK